MKKITKAILIGVAIDAFYGHFYAIWRNVSPDTFNCYFKTKDELYGKIGIDKLWKKNKD